MASIISAGTTSGTALNMSGDTTGNLAFQTQAGTYTQTLPNATGTILTTASAGTTGTSMVLISSATASSSATIDFTSISNTSYNSYRLYITNVVCSTNATNLLLRMSNAGTFATASYTWQNFRWTTAGTGVAGQGATGTGIALNATSDPMSNASLSGGSGASFVVDICECSNATAYKRVNVQGMYLGSAQLGIVGNGASPSISAVDGFRLLMDAGTITSGTFFLYGIKNA